MAMATIDVVIAGWKIVIASQGNNLGVEIIAQLSFELNKIYALHSYLRFVLQIKTMKTKFVSSQSIMLLT